MNGNIYPLLQGNAGRKEETVYRYMNFSTYLIEMTGLSIYDFSVLTWGPFTNETNEEEVTKYLDEWLEYGPCEELKERARNDLADRGYIDMGV